MARTAKTPRFNEFNSAPNGFGHRAQDPQKWNQYLDDSKPLNLELGCGKAEVSLFLASKYPDQNFMGIDLKADRLWRASKNSLALGQENTAFVQGNILHIEEYIQPKSVSMIWLTHPDPFPKDRQAKHRMMQRNFLDIYKKLLTDDGVVRFKTDNIDLFNWAEEFLSEQKDVDLGTVTRDLHGEIEDEDLLVETTFSQKYIARGTKINYLDFTFKAS